jgi:hypothetical protein
MYGGTETLKWNAENQNTWHVIRTWKTSLHGQNHGIFSSVKVSGTHSNLIHDSTLYYRKNHSSEFHTFNKEQGKYIKAQNCTSYWPLLSFFYFQVILILLNDRIY